MPGLNTKSYYTGVVDNNDLSYVIERFGNPKRILPAPISRFKIGVHKGKPKINPHVSSFIMKDGRTVSVFHVKPVYYLHINGEWRPLSEVTTYHGNRKLILNNKWEQIEPWYLRWLMKRCELIGGQVLIPWRFDNVPIREGQEIYFTVTTVYPDPDVESTSVDGWARHTGQNSWSVAHDATDGTAAADADAATIVGRTLLTGGNYAIQRSFFLYDTSGITDTDTVDAAVLSLAGQGTAAVNDDTTNQDIVSSSPASNTAITTADYDAVGATVYANIALSSWVSTDTTYNDFTLDANGRANISLTDISKFGGRNSRDTGNSAPLGENTVQAYYADNAGTTSDPKLAVTHTAAAVSVMSYFMGSGFWGA